MKEKFLTIGQVVQKLQPSFPDLSISKVRYLEDEGLINPERTNSGYRKFSENDVKQLEVILKLQKEQFLPLSVIKQKIKTVKTDELTSELEAPKKETFFSASKDNKRFTLADISQKTGLSEQEIHNLETYSILKPEETPEGKSYDDSDVKLASIAKRFSRIGLEPRHLRMYETFAEREAQLLWQILLPELKRLKPEHSQKVLSDLSELLDQSQDLKDILLKRALDQYFGNF